MSNEDPNKKHYFDTITNNEASEIFFKASKSKSEIMQLWLPGNEKGSEENFVLVDFKKKDSEFILNQDSGFFKKVMGGSKLSGQSVCFKISLEKYHYFSTGKLITDGKFYRLSGISTIYIGQQRSNFRLDASKHVIVNLRLRGILYSCNDISAGGTSFDIPKDQASAFTKGKVFKDLSLQLCQQTYFIPEAEVAGLWPSDKNPGELKVGLAFQNLPKKQEEDLFLQVNSEARGEEIRKMLGQNKPS